MTLTPKQYSKHIKIPWTEKKQTIVLSKNLKSRHGTEAQIAGLFATELLFTRTTPLQEVWQELLYLMMVKDLPDNSVERGSYLYNIWAETCEP